MEKTRWRSPAAGPDCYRKIDVSRGGGATGVSFLHGSDKISSKQLSTELGTKFSTKFGLLVWSQDVLNARDQTSCNNLEHELLQFIYDEI